MPKLGTKVDASVKIGQKSLEHYKIGQKAMPAKSKKPAKHSEEALEVLKKLKF